MHTWLPFWTTLVNLSFLLLLLVSHLRLVNNQQQKNCTFLEIGYKFNITLTPRLGVSLIFMGYQTGGQVIP